MKLGLVAIFVVVVAGLPSHAEAGSRAAVGFYCQSNNNTPVKPKTPPSRKSIAPTGSTPPVAPAKPAATPKSVPTELVPIPPSASPITAKSSPASSAKGKTALDTDMLVLESLGIRFRPISGAILTKPVTGAMPIYTVDDSSDPARYHLQIQTLVSGLSEPSPQAQVNEYLESMRKKNQKFTVILNEPWIHPKADGHILFTQTDLGEGVVAVQGWLILQTGPFEFLVVNTLTSREDFFAIRSALEESFHTIELDDLEKLAAKRVDRLRSGNDLLQAMTPEKMKALCGAEPRLFRVWQAVESEAWTSRVTERGGKLKEKTLAQTGLRSPRATGNPRQVLTVINANAQSRTRDEKEWTVPSGIYLSQAELLVLGELLPRDEKQAALNFALYAFDPRSMSMPQRAESWTRAADGQWMLVTQPGIDESAEITWHDANGRLIRRSEPGGFMTEICLPRQLQQIWTGKGLQIR